MLDWVLIPLMTGEEDELVLKLKDAGKIILLFVIDEKLKQKPALEVQDEIKKAEEYLEKIKKEVEKTKPNALVDDYLEWGKWDEKITSIAKIEAVKTILAKKNDEIELIAPKLKASGLEVELMD